MFYHSVNRTLKYFIKPQKKKKMNYDKTFDQQLLKTKEINPNWLPFIGIDYKKNENKILVIGESCYLNDIVNINQEDYIKKLIEAQGLKKGWYATGDESEHTIDPRHKKLEKILSVDPENIECKREFWSKAAYYNLIQTALESRDTKDRPHFLLYLSGWEVLFQILKIMKPKYCVMNGVESFNHCHEKPAELNGFMIKEKIRFEKIGNTYPRKIIIENTISGDNIKLLFIKHTSLPMDPEPWQRFIKSKII